MQGVGGGFGWWKELGWTRMNSLELRDFAVTYA